MMEMNVIATLQETWAAHLLDIVARLLNVKTELNVGVALQETLPRSWGSCEHASNVKTGMNIAVALQETRPNS